ncbi:hypothetical protein [Luteolibacter sp. Populi]|uniref:hypothetical protein n=1 Tax=Luteolibacter sp. Populi TaxID=3230487 RepID=UPI003467D69A
MNLIDDFSCGRICLALGAVLMVWGACREPMLATKQEQAVLPALRVASWEIGLGDDSVDLEGSLVSRSDGPTLPVIGGE